MACREESKKKADIESRNEIFRKQREEALKQRMERLSGPNSPGSFQAPLGRKSPSPYEDSSTSGPLRLPSYNAGLYEVRTCNLAPFS